MFCLLDRQLWDLWFLFSVTNLDLHLANFQVSSTSGSQRGQSTYFKLLWIKLAKVVLPSTIWSNASPLSCQAVDLEEPNTRWEPNRSFGSILKLSQRNEPFDRRPLFSRVHLFRGSNGRAMAFSTPIFLGVDLFSCAHQHESVKSSFRTTEITSSSCEKSSGRRYHLGMVSSNHF